MRIVSYNSRGLRLGNGAGDRARRIVVDKLLEDVDILCLQETMLPKQNLDRLNSFHCNFFGAGESTTDLSSGIIQGRIPGGVAILWHKDYDPFISVVRLNVDWCIAVKIVMDEKVFMILNIYMPYESHQNEDEYLAKLGFLSSFISQCEFNCVFIVGDMNADISDTRSTFGQHLIQFCVNNNLVLTSKERLPADSHTYVSEAWHSTSWLDHCICTEDAHECISRVEILYSLATTDHIPVSLVVNCESLPVLLQHQSPSHTEKLTWAKVSVEDIRKYYLLSDCSLRSVSVHKETLQCRDVNCEHMEHRLHLCTLYQNIVDSLIIASEFLCQKGATKFKPLPGWSEHAYALHAESRAAYKVWAAAGKPKSGSILESKKAANVKFKNAVRYIKRNEQTMRANSLANKLKNNDVSEFWKELKRSCISKQLLPASINGVSGDKNIVEAWRNHFSRIFNCVNSERFNLGNINYNHGMIVRADEVRLAIEKMSLNKACGPDQLSAEHMKYASCRAQVLLSLCFTGFLKHGILPDHMLSVLLVPIVKEKTGKISCIDNYRPIAMASVLSKVFEHILLERLQNFITTTENQFGFKGKLSTDLCIYALKETVSKYMRHNTSVFMCFLDASKAFDRVNHQKLFIKLQNRGVPSYLVRILHFWYSHQLMQVKWGTEVSEPFSVSNGVRQGGILSPVLFNLYLDELSVTLNASKTGCLVGDRLVNHLIYADDLVLMSPYSAGLQQLLRACAKYGEQFDILFNPKKSVVMIAATKGDLKLNFPSFNLTNQVLEVVSKVKYLGHILRSDLCDDEDIKRQCGKLYMQANTLARNFGMCSDPVKVSLFRSFCTPLYTAHLWCNYSKVVMKKLQVAYQDAFRILMKLPRWTSASHMFVVSNIPTFHALLRLFMYKFICRLSLSANAVVRALPSLTYSDTRYSSVLFKHWNNCLYGL
uniref:Reverse transcriptase domain-containing protein n=1 Tax=Nothobranchius furzeri TaxID=105023 RepID=A0A8C6PWR0_NOTFU